MNKNNEDLDEILKKAISFDDPLYYLNIEKVHELKLDNVICEYYLIKCSADDVLEKQFLRQLRDIIVIYALKKNEYEDEVSKYDIGRLWSIAKNRFVKSNKTGEPGELIIFCVLETIREAPQLINKMSLKTSGNVHYHGLDGIHIGVKDGQVILYYGESKIHQNVSGGIKDSIDSIYKIHSSANKEEFEMNLISNNIDFEKYKENIELIKEIINPYSNIDRSNFRKIYSIFIGFNWNCLDNIDFSSISANIKSILEKCLIANSERLLENCHKEVKASNIDYQFEFFFIPFKNVDKIREIFLEEVLN